MKIKGGVFFRGLDFFARWAVKAERLADVSTMAHSLWRTRLVRVDLLINRLQFDLKITKDEDLHTREIFDYVFKFGESV